MTGLIFIVSLISFVAILIFFMFQAVYKGRSPIKVFFGPITRKEFKVLCSIVESTELKEVKVAGMDSVWSVNNEQFMIRYDWAKERYNINQVHLSFFQESALLRAMDRNRIKATMLTRAGQVLYGGKK